MINPFLGNADQATVSFGARNGVEHILVQAEEVFHKIAGHVLFDCVYKQNPKNYQLIEVQQFFVRRCC